MINKWWARGLASPSDFEHFLKKYRRNGEGGSHPTSNTFCQLLLWRINWSRFHFLLSHNLLPCTWQICDPLFIIVSESPQGFYKLTQAASAVSFYKKRGVARLLLKPISDDHSLSSVGCDALPATASGNMEVQLTADPHIISPIAIPFRGSIYITAIPGK